MKRIQELVNAFRSLPDGKKELEMRLGVWEDGQFRAGVSRETFEDLQKDLMSLNHLESEDKWTEIVDYHYSTADGSSARTRVMNDIQSLTMITEHTNKDNVCSSVFQHENSCNGETCRIAVSSEIPLTSVPEHCMPTYVRIKQRKRFVDVRGGREVWSYELSKTWAGSTRTAVEKMQHLAEPQYEVECELVDVGGVYMADRTTSTVAESICLKATNLLGQEAQGGDSLISVQHSGRKRRR